MTESATTAWESSEIERLAGVEQVDISTRRDDGSLRPFVPIWLVTVGSDVYVRSYRGTRGAWYRHAMTPTTGAISTGGTTRDVEFAPAERITRSAIDDAYRRKYARYGQTYLATILGDDAVTATLKLSPKP